MHKIFMNITIFLLIIIFIIAFSSSYSSLNIDNLAYVLAIGIDKSDKNKLQVTFEFASTAASESGSSEKITPIINSVDASSISNAINLINSYIVKGINMSHCKSIIFSEELAYEGISDEIYTLINDTQVRPSANIIISKCKAKDYIKYTIPELENSKYKYYEIMSNSSKYTGYSIDSSIGDFFNSLACKGCEPYAILGGINQQNTQNSASVNSQKDSNIKSNETSIEGENGTENIGIAVFKGDTLVGELNAIETVAFSILKGNLDRFLVSVPDPINQGNYLDIYFTPYQPPDIKIDTSSASPYVHVKAKLSGRIYSMSQNSSYLEPETLDAISESCNSYLESVISDVLYKTSIDFHSDVMGFGKYALSNFLTTQDFDNYNWLNNYQHAFFDIDIDSSVKSGMLITET